MSLLESPQRGNINTRDVFRPFVTVEIKSDNWSDPRYYRLAQRNAFGNGWTVYTSDEKTLEILDQDVNLGEDGKIHEVMLLDGEHLTLRIYEQVPINANRLKQLMEK